MTHRLYISQYTPDELRALPAGPLLDWLACEGMGMEMIQCNLDGVVIHTYDNCYWPEIEEAPANLEHGHYSSDPSLVGPMMQRLRELGYVDIDFSRNSSGHGVFACQRRSDPDSAIDVGGVSDPHALAVALVLAVRQQAQNAIDNADKEGPDA